MTKRDIKFRAYTEKYGLVAVRRLTNTTLDIFDVELENGVIVLAGSSRYPDVTIEQYTGRKDANGVDVYDGDFVTCSQGCPHRVIWAEAHGGTIVGGMPGWYLSGLDDGYAWTSEEKVIGNIHENPELLEV